MSLFTDDFVFLAILIGNDYVPGLAAYLFEPTWARYRKLKLGKTAMRNEFVFDAASKKVNWALVNSISGGIDFDGEDESLVMQDEQPARFSEEPEHDSLNGSTISSFGRLHPKSVVCEMLILNADVPVFEGETPGLARACVLFCFVVSGEELWQRSRPKNQSDHKLWNPSVYPFCGKRGAEQIVQHKEDATLAIRVIDRPLSAAHMFFSFSFVISGCFS